MQLGMLHGSMQVHAAQGGKRTGLRCSRLEASIWMLRQPQPQPVSMLVPWKWSTGPAQRQIRHPVTPTCAEMTGSRSLLGMLCSAQHADCSLLGCLTRAAPCLTQPANYPTQKQ